MLKKIKNRCGSAMTLSIVVIFLVGIFISTMTSMIINQTKFNIKNANDTNLKYESEEGIEEVIADFIDNINLSGGIGQNIQIEKAVEFDILVKYIELVDIIIGSDGINDAMIYNTLELIKSGNVSKEDMSKLSYQINIVKDEIQQQITSNTLKQHGYRHKDVIRLLNIAQLYAEFFRDNFFDSETQGLYLNIDYKLCINFINQVLYNLREIEYETSSEYKGGLGIGYRDLNFEIHDILNYRLRRLYNKFKDKNTIKDIYNPYKDLTDEDNTIDIDNSMDLWIKNNIPSMINTIENTDYEYYIDRYIRNIKNNYIIGYISTSKIKNSYYRNSSDNCNIDAKKLLSKRLEIINLEIDSILQWLNYMEVIMEGRTEGEQKFTVSIPKSTDKFKTYKVTHYTINEDNVILLPNEDTDNYVFEVLKIGPDTKISLKLNVTSKVEDSQKGSYEIQSNVIVKIDNIVSKNRYDIDYEIESWNKI